MQVREPGKEIYYRQAEFRKCTEEDFMNNGITDYNREAIL